MNYEFNQHRDDELGREMEARELREMQDPVFLRGQTEVALDDPPFAPDGSCAEYEEPEPECECEQIDVDYWDNRYCPAHGPHSESARRQLQQEADDEAAAARLIPFLLGEDWRAA